MTSPRIYLTLGITAVPLALGILTILLPAYAENSFLDLPIILREPEIVTQFSPPLTQFPLVGWELIVQSELKNMVADDIWFTYIVQIKDQNGESVALKWVKGSISGLESIVAAQRWTPESYGIYKIETFVWTDLENPVVLSRSKSITMPVTRSPIVGSPILIKPFSPLGLENAEMLTSYQPAVAKVVVGVNNTVTWVNMDETLARIESDNIYTSNSFQALMKPGETFSLTFNETGVYGYHGKSWERGTIVVTTSEIEASNLALSSSLKSDARDLAEMLVKLTNDQIIKTRLEVPTNVGYITNKGDILISTIPEDYRFVDYRIEEKVIALDEDRALDFAKNFMKNLGLKMDGSEWINVENFGDFILITIQQRKDGWIITNQFVKFHFYKERAWIQIGRWYDNIQKIELHISQDEAKGIAKKFMDKEVIESDRLRKYNYTSGKPGWVSMEIIDDKLMYVVAVGYQTDEKFEGYHCALTTFLVYVDPVNGLPFGWRFPTCE